jgi:hypothetical protein
VSKVIAGVVLESEARAAPAAAQPSILLLERGAAPGAAAGGRQRLHLLLHSGEPCWGVMNMTGPVAGYSFSDGLPNSTTTQVRHVRTGVAR